MTLFLGNFFSSSKKSVKVRLQSHENQMTIKQWRSRKAYRVKKSVNLVLSEAGISRAKIPNQFILLSKKQRRKTLQHDPALARNSKITKVEARKQDHRAPMARQLSRSRYHLNSLGNDQAELVEIQHSLLLLCSEILCFFEPLQYHQSLLRTTCQKS